MKVGKVPRERSEQVGDFFLEEIHPLVTLAPSFDSKGGELTQKRLKIPEQQGAI